MSISPKDLLAISCNQRSSLVSYRIRIPDRKISMRYTEIAITCKRYENALVNLGWSDNQGNHTGSPRLSDSSETFLIFSKLAEHLWQRPVFNQQVISPDITKGFPPHKIFTRYIVMTEKERWTSGKTVKREQSILWSKQVIHIPILTWKIIDCLLSINWFWITTP